MKRTTFEAKYKGKTYHGLTILEAIPVTDEHVFYVKAKCSLCGNVKKMLAGNIIYGLSKSCGCQTALKASKMGQDRVKYFIDTPKGPLSINAFCAKYDLERSLIYHRVRNGETDMNRLLIKPGEYYQRKYHYPALNGRTMDQAVHDFGVSRQTIHNRMKAKWTLDKQDRWHRPGTRRTIGVGRMKVSKRKYVRKSL